MQKINKLLSHKTGPIWFTFVFLFIYTFIGSLLTVAYGPIQGMFYIDVFTAIVAWMLLSKKFGNLAIYSHYKFTNKKQMILLGFGLLIVFVLVWFLGQIIGSVIFNYQPHSSYNQYQQMKMQNVQGYILCSIWVAPVCEELMYRGVIYSVFKKQFNWMFAWFLQAFIFAGMHMTWVQFFGVFLLALLLGIVVDITGNIYWSIGLHIIYNWGSFYMSGVKIPAVLTQPWLLALVYILLMGCLSWIYFKMVITPKTAKRKDSKY